MINVILTGTYNSKNKGDAAMEISTAGALLKASEDIKVAIHSPFPEMDRPFYSPVPVIRCSRRRLIWGSMLILRGFLWRLLKWDFLVKGNRELESYANAHVVVDLSGDMQTESYGPHVAYSHFIPIALALAMNRPVMLCAQSIGPFKFTMPLAKFLFNKVDLITVRDRISQAYVKRMNVSAPVVFTADMAFLLKPGSGKRIDAILEKEAIDTSKNRICGVSVSGLIANHFSKKNPLSRKMSFEQFMAQELDRFIEKSDMDCVFIAHVTGPAEIKDDRITAQKVVQKMKYSHRAHIIKGDYRPDELKGILKRFWIHTGARMHASIGAVTSGVPVAPIAYSHKTPGVMAQFGLSDYVIDISQWRPGMLADRLLKLCEEKEHLSKKILTRIDGLVTKSKTNIDYIFSLISNQR